MESSFSNQKQKSQYMIQTEGVLGEKLVTIDILDDDVHIDLSKPIIGEDSIDVQDLAEMFAQAAESFTKTSTEMSQINMKELADVMQESSQALLDTSEGINKIVDELNNIAHKSKRLVDRIEQKVIDGDLFKVF